MSSRELERELTELKTLFSIMRGTLGDAIVRQRKMEQEIRELRQAVSDIDRRQADCIGVNDNIDVTIYLDPFTGRKTVQFKKV